MWALLIVALWPFAGEVADDVVVARAQKGQWAVEITAGRLRAYAEAHPDRSPRVLAHELLEFELLAAEADRRGLADDAAVRRAVNEVMVQRLLITDFEPTWTAESLPVDMVRESYRKNRGFFVRPEIRDGDHLLATLDDKRPTDPEVDAGCRALLEKIRAELLTAPVPNREAFRARVDQYQAEAKALGITLRAEKLPFFALKGRMLPAFSEAMFALDAPGQLTAVFPTQFGWHLGRVETIKPALNRSFEEAEAELRKKITPEVRPHKFRQRTEELARKAQALIDTTPLERQAEAQGLEPR
jgi:hypothetical protein